MMTTASLEPGGWGGVGCVGTGSQLSPLRVPRPGHWPLPHTQLPACVCAGSSGEVVRDVGSQPHPPHPRAAPAGGSALGGRECGQVASPGQGPGSQCGQQDGREETCGLLGGVGDLNWDMGRIICFLKPQL